MNAARLFLLLGGEIRGPFRSEQLHELVAGGAITPATEAATSATGPWSPLSAWPDCDTLFPQRPEILFKAAEFVAVNSPSTPPVDHRDLIAWANLAPPPGVVKPTAPTAPKPDPVNEVLEFVREVARVDEKYAKPMVFPTRRHQYRRLLHYLILAAVGCAVVVGIGIYYRPLDAMSVMILSGWAILYVGGLAMIMLMIMPRH